jgi:hypothetical protein
MGREDEVGVTNESLGAHCKVENRPIPRRLPGRLVLLFLFAQMDAAGGAGADTEEAQACPACFFTKSRLEVCASVPGMGVN